MCLDNRVRLIIVDSVRELDNLIRLCHLYDKKTRILLRINPDYVPRGMNQGSATGSRKGCAFGLDLKGTEVLQALQILNGSEMVDFQGFQFHIGTGITDPLDYTRALTGLRNLVNFTRSLGFQIKVFDAGGGIGTPASREMTTLEMIMYQGLERLPGMNESAWQPPFSEFANSITEGMLRLFKPADLPELMLEPGRCIASSAQMLLLTVHQIKERARMKKWIITDGGIGTVTMPTFYEYHEVFLCNDLKRPRTDYVTITGPVCFAADIVYRNKKMPVLHPGEILAIMDSGAYFTAWESSFGFARPAIIAVSEGHHRLLRRRETYEDMVARDRMDPAGMLLYDMSCLRR
jgi:diaminopimelate decarboxylase